MIKNLTLDHAARQALVLAIDDFAVYLGPSDADLADELHDVSQRLQADGTINLYDVEGDVGWSTLGQVCAEYTHQDEHTATLAKLIQLFATLSEVA